MRPVVDHIQITVRDMARAVPFYDALLPLLGYDLARKTEAVIEEHELHVVEYIHPSLLFAINGPRAGLAHEQVHRRRPGSLHHLAFRVDDRAQVDALHAELVKLAPLGATIVSAPREFPEYSPAGYYAVFFKDPDGIKLEIMWTPKTDAGA